MKRKNRNKDKKTKRNREQKTKHCAKKREDVKIMKRNPGIFPINQSFSQHPNPGTKIVSGC